MFHNPHATIVFGWFPANAPPPPQGAVTGHRCGSLNGDRPAYNLLLALAFLSFSAFPWTIVCPGIPLFFGAHCRSHRRSRALPEGVASHRVGNWWRCVRHFCRPRPLLSWLARLSTAGQQEATHAHTHLRVAHGSWPSHAGTTCCGWGSLPRRHGRLSTALPLGPEEAQPLPIRVLGQKSESQGSPKAGACLGSAFCVGVYLAGVLPPPSFTRGST